jgi:hypothetical protein
MRATQGSGLFFLLLGIVGILCVPMAVPAAQVSVQSDTLLRVFQRDTATDTDASVIPVYEYMQVDIGTADEPGLALHLYGWGRWDMADNDYYADATAGELLYGYLEYTHELARFNARVGRQQVFEGVANEAVDGLRISSDLGKYFSGSIYAGQPVGVDIDEGRSGDSIYGGRLAHHLAGRYDLGVSYKKIRNDSEDAEETAGVDLSAYLPHGTNIHGFSAYNLDTDDWGEHSYELAFALGPVALRPYFQRFQYEDYFGTGANSANPFRFLAKTGEELSVGGADLTLPAGESWVLAFKAKHYDYKVLDDTSQFYSAQAIRSGEGHSQVGGEIGYMKGDAAQNDYYLIRVFTYWDQLPEGWLLAFVSGDVVFVGYDEDIYGEDSSLFISLATGKKFLEEALELKLSGDYSRDPYFDGDLRAMLTARYHFGRNL